MIDIAIPFPDLSQFLWFFSLGIHLFAILVMWFFPIGAYLVDNQNPTGGHGMFESLLIFTVVWDILWTLDLLQFLGIINIHAA